MLAVLIVVVADGTHTEGPLANILPGAWGQEDSLPVSLISPRRAQIIEGADSGEFLTASCVNRESWDGSRIKYSSFLSHNMVAYFSGTEPGHVLPFLQLSPAGWWNAWRIDAIQSAPISDISCRLSPDILVGHTDNQRGDFVRKIAECESDGRHPRPYSGFCHIGRATSGVGDLSGESQRCLGVGGLPYRIATGVFYSGLSQISKPTCLVSGVTGGEEGQSDDRSIDKIDAVAFKVYVSGSIMRLAGIIVSGVGANRRRRYLWLCSGVIMSVAGFIVGVFAILLSGI